MSPRGSALHVGGVVSDDLDHGLYRVGAHDYLEQAGCHCDAGDGEGLGQVLSQTAGRVKG
jgi:hypothetical protein